MQMYSHRVLSTKESESYFEHKSFYIRRLIDTDLHYMQSNRCKIAIKTLGSNHFQIYFPCIRKS